MGCDHLWPLWPFDHIPHIDLFVFKCLLICIVLLIWEIKLNEIKLNETTPILPCAMASSAMEVQLGVFGFLLTAHAEKKNTCKQNAPTIFACCVVFHTCLSSCSDRSTYVPDESQLKKKPKYPQLEPHAGIRMAQVLGAPFCIRGSNSL